MRENYSDHCIKIILFIVEKLYNKIWENYTIEYRKIIPYTIWKNYTIQYGKIISIKYGKIILYKYNKEKSKIICKIDFLINKKKFFFIFENK